VVARAAVTAKFQPKRATGRDARKSRNRCGRPRAGAWVARSDSWIAGYEEKDASYG
jgi:hypothetical protein